MQGKGKASGSAGASTSAAPAVDGSKDEDEDQPAAKKQVKSAGGAGMRKAASASAVTQCAALKPLVNRRRSKGASEGTGALAPSQVPEAEGGQAPNVVGVAAVAKRRGQVARSQSVSTSAAALHPRQTRGKLVGADADKRGEGEARRRRNSSVGGALRGKAPGAAKRGKAVVGKSMTASTAKRGSCPLCCATCLTHWPRVPSGCRPTFVLHEPCATQLHRRLVNEIPASLGVANDLVMGVPVCW